MGGDGAAGGHFAPVESRASFCEGGGLDKGTSIGVWEFWGSSTPSFRGKDLVREAARPRGECPPWGLLGKLAPAVTSCPSHLSLSLSNSRALRLYFLVRFTP